MKERIRDAASRLVTMSGLSRLGRSLTARAGTLILYGHRISADDEGYMQGLAPEWFEQQVRYLARHREIIPLSVLVACLEQRTPPPPRSVVLTLDDGFRDNYAVGLPILDKLGVPATIFVITGSLSDGRLPWSQRLGYTFQHTSVPELRYPLLGTEPVTLTSERYRRHAYQSIKQRLLTKTREVRDDHIARLADSLGVVPPVDRMMTWEHARDALARGHEIGAHTYSHALLAHLPLALAREEMLRSKEDLDQHLGVTKPAFCFPAGSTTPELNELARAMGFRGAFLPDHHRRFNRTPEVDAFTMVRVGLANGPGRDLEAELDGPFHALRKAAGRYHLTRGP